MEFLVLYVCMQKDGKEHYQLTCHPLYASHGP